MDVSIALCIAHSFKPNHVDSLFGRSFEQGTDLSTPVNHLPEWFFLLLNALPLVFNFTEPHNVTTFALKGQCHEMVVEVRPWSGRLALN
jgi:hypothetical protein